MAMPQQLLVLEQQIKEPAEVKNLREVAVVAVVQEPQVLMLELIMVVTVALVLLHLFLAHP